MSVIFFQLIIIFSNISLMLSAQTELFFLFIFSGGTSSVASNEKIMNLEQKIYKLQEELTEQHRNRGEVQILLL